MTRLEIIERLCKIAEEVRTETGMTGPNDCFCGKGGFWSSPSYTDAQYRNDGEVLAFIERAVRDALRTRDNGAAI